jgi:hypothetical protein
MSVDIPLVPPGARVRVRRATLPLPAGLDGRLGTVIGSSEYYPNHYDVALDGTAEIRCFAPGELEVLEPLELAPDRVAASRRLARP